MAELPLFIDDNPPLTSLVFDRRCADGGTCELGAIFVDYLQLMQGDGERGMSIARKRWATSREV